MPTLHQCDVSVIVPVYNLERWIMPLLESLKAQDLGPYTAEFIFVLNNCTDDSESVIRDSGLPCKILQCAEQGCGLARNMGFEESCGEYIWFVDGDDRIISDTAIRDLLARMKADDLDIIRIPFLSNGFGWYYFSMVWQYMFRREFIEEFRFRKEQPGEDDAYMLLVLWKAGYDQTTYGTMPNIGRALYFYNYPREGSNMDRYRRGENINE